MNYKRGIIILLLSTVCSVNAEAIRPQTCLGDLEFEELLARENCKWGISYSACVVAAATAGATLLMVRATNERQSSRAVSGQRPKLEAALNQFSGSLGAVAVLHRQQSDAVKQIYVNDQKIARMQRDLNEMKDDTGLGPNAKAAARAGMLAEIDELEKKNQNLVEDMKTASRQFKEVSEKRSAASSELGKRVPNIFVMREDEPYKKYEQQLGKISLLLDREIELKDLEKSAKAKLKRPGFETSELAAIRRERQEIGKKIEAHQSRLFSAWQDYAHMMNMRSRMSRYANAAIVGVGAGLITQAVSDRNYSARCREASEAWSADPEFKNYFSLDNSCRIQSNPEQMKALAELGDGERTALLSKPKFCSAAKKYLQELRVNQKFAKLDPEKTTCDFPRMIHYEIDGQKFANKMEQLDNGNYRMTGSFIPDSPLSGDLKDPTQFQLLIHQEKDGDLLPGTFKTRNPNWTAMDLSQWSELATRRTILESPAKAGYPKPEERENMVRPTTNLTARLQESADSQWRAIQETALTVAVGCASGLLGNGDAKKPVTSTTAAVEQ